MKFTKMQGCGNDYILIDEEKETVEEKEKGKLAKKLCDRHFGVGADGILYVKKIPKEDKLSLERFSMEIYNMDGSKANMCGNGMRCVAAYVYKMGYLKEKRCNVICGGAVKGIEILKEEPLQIRVNMGKPELMAQKIPVLSASDFVINETIGDAFEVLRMTCVSMGNPHAVIYVESPTKELVERIGPKIAYGPRFPEHTNVEFVKVMDREHLTLRVWERGVGETLACGTGCCAALVASYINGLTERKVTVKLLGGKLCCEWDSEDANVYLTGPAKFVYEGEVKDY